MSDHDNDTCPHLVRASLLEAENTRLKAEVQHLMIFCNSTLIPSKELQEEIARLKAENARLRASSFVTAVPVEQYEKLKAEVERLIKAGDGLYELALPYRREYYPEGDAWYYAKKASKEGKSSV